MKRFVRVIAVALSSAAVVWSMLSAGSVAFAGHRRVDIYAFMTGLACVESGGRYDALNSYSHAYGKYQIMPRIWPAWSARYINDRWAPPTPRNQEYVARQRISDLFALHRSWRLVAHWWLTGNATSDETIWSAGSVHYVNEVMSYAVAAANPAASDVVPAACLPGDYRDPRIRLQPWPRAVTIGRVFMRVAAGYENRATGTLPRGTRVAVLATGADQRGKPWLRVGLRDGRTAWIAGWYTKPVTP